MHERETKDFLIRNMPLELYQLLENAAKAHHRSRTQEAIVALTNGLTAPSSQLKKPKPFQWGKKITNRLIQDSIEEGRE